MALGGNRVSVVDSTGRCRHSIDCISLMFLLTCRKGDCSKAKKELGWVPEITFQELVKDMMKNDIANVDSGNEHA